jgi:hypothetical protein
MFYKQPWSSISADIIDDKKTRWHAAEEGSRDKSFYLLLAANG